MRIHWIRGIRVPESKKYDIKLEGYIESTLPWEPKIVAAFIEDEKGMIAYKVFDLKIQVTPKEQI